jgi:hypothetical protein
MSLVLLLRRARALAARPAAGDPRLAAAPAGVPVVVRPAYTYRTCPGCHAVAVRPVRLPTRVPVYPPGHEVLLRWGPLIVDRCPG